MNQQNQGIGSAYNSSNHLKATLNTQQGLVPIPIRVNLTEQGISLLDSAITEQNNIISDLIMRLQCITQNNTPEGTEENCKRETMPRIPQSIHLYADCVAINNSRLRSLLSNLEV